VALYQHNQGSKVKEERHQGCARLFPPLRNPTNLSTQEKPRSYYSTAQLTGLGTSTTAKELQELMCTSDLERAKQKRSKILV